MSVDDVDVLVIGAGLAGLRCAGVLAAAGREVRRVIDRFLAGVVLEGSGETSNAFVLLLLRMFVLGVPALPAEGMQALPRLLAAPIDDRISLQHNVVDMCREGSRWRVTGGAGTVRANQVVIATDPGTAADLAGLPAPAMHGVVTDWWATEDAPADPPMLWVDGREAAGPVVNTAVISAAAPSYAPPGQHLVAASALLGTDGSAPDEPVIRRHAADILGTDATRWSLLVRHVVPNALPAQQPPLAVRRRVRLGDGRWVCGDHRDTASIQGALVSGRRTAESLLTSPG